MHVCNQGQGRSLTIARRPRWIQNQLLQLISPDAPKARRVCEETYSYTIHPLFRPLASCLCYSACPTLVLSANCALRTTPHPLWYSKIVPAFRCTSSARTRGYPRQTARRGCPGRGRASGLEGTPAIAASREGDHGLLRGLSSRTGEGSRWERTCGGEQTEPGAAVGGTVVRVQEHDLTRG